MVSYLDVSSGSTRTRSPSPRGSSLTGLSPGRPLGYKELPLSPADRRRVEKDVKELLDKAVRKARKKGKIPLSPRQWALDQLLGSAARTAFEGLATEVLWGLTEQDVRATPGQWYFRLSLNDLGSVPRCANYNDGQGTFASLASCNGAFSGLWKYLSRELDQSQCSGPVSYYRTHRISPCSAGEVEVEPQTEARPAPLPPDPFTPSPDETVPMPDLVGYWRTGPPRLWQIVLPLAPDTGSGLGWYVRVGQIVGRAGRGIRERKLRSVAGGLAVAWFLTTVLEVVPELKAVWEKHFGDNFDGHENVDKVELFVDLFLILAEEIFLDPILARAFNDRFPGVLPRVEQISGYDAPGLPQIGV